MVYRRGTKPKRSKNAKMLAEVEAHDPDAHAALLELRHHNPQAFRKRLRRLARQGVVHDAYAKPPAAEV